MKYQVIVLDLDGTLTNSKKEITPPTRDALIEIQQNGKKVVLASGRPINGVAPLAEELYLKEYGGFMLSFNGARITRYPTGSHPSDLRGGKRISWIGPYLLYG